MSGITAKQQTTTMAKACATSLHTKPALKKRFAMTLVLYRMVMT